jgi:carboxyl-terminal processing protease
MQLLLFLISSCNLGFFEGCSKKDISFLNKEADNLKNAKNTNISFSTEATIAISNVCDLVMKHFKGNIEEKDLVEYAAKGIINGLKDPYSQILSKDHLEHLNTSLISNTIEGGIGVHMTKLNSTSDILIVHTIKNAPAELAGLKRGDQILEIDGLNVQDLSIKESSEKIKGKIGSTVKLKVSRRDMKPFIVSVKRAKVSIDNVDFKMVNDSIGLISLKQFASNVGNEVKDALESLKSKGAKSIILDLRDNSGGVASEAVAVASVFINKNPIVIQKFKSEIIKYDSLGNADEEIPLLVLINGGSASASEIVAGALKDHERAILIGEKTYGKGTMQAIVPFSDYGIKITIADFYSPSENVINEVGIAPHIYIGQDSSALKLVLNSEKYGLNNINNYYIDILNKVDEQREIQMQTAIKLIIALKGDFSEFKK